jgi:hypothetical protein
VLFIQQPAALTSTSTPGQGPSPAKPGTDEARQEKDPPKNGQPSNNSNNARTYVAARPFFVKSQNKPDCFVVFFYSLWQKNTHTHKNKIDQQK